MPDIVNYAETVKLILGEGAKYFVLLLFAVLAIRFWRNVQASPAGQRGKTIAFACLASAVAGAVGYVSIRHSLGLMYSSYGLRAFQAGRVDSAFNLFQNAAHYWRSADAVGQEGVCLVLMNQSGAGRQLLAEAKAMRHDRATPFEEFHLGLVCFLSGRPDEAVPLLESASRDSTYQWRVTKLLCLIALDKNEVDDAVRLMQPFAKAEIQEDDHAYIAACLKLADGKTNEARTIVEKYDTETLSPRWKTRFDDLRAKIHD